MINDGCTATEIAKVLHVSKQRLSYHFNKAIKLGYVTDRCRDTFKPYELTQPGKNFLAMYQNNNKLGQQPPICRAEDVRFKAPIFKLPSKPVDLHKVEMHNWNQYNGKVGSIKVKLNVGNNPTIEFLPAAIDGKDPLKLYFKLYSDCGEVAKNLEEMFDMQIGRLELSSKGEWVIYNPLAKAITNMTGRITVEGIGKINASLPNRYGDFEFHDPRAAAEFNVPQRLVKLEQEFDVLKQDVGEIKQDIKELVKRQGTSDSEDKGGYSVEETVNEV
jgi:hypothetical protein